MEDQTSKYMRFRKNWDFHRIKLHLSKINELHLLVRKLVGFDYFSFTLRQPLPVSAPPLYIFSNFPEAFNRLYDENLCWRIDPVVNCVRNSDSDIWGVDYEIWRKSDEKNEQILDLLKGFDEIKNGVSFWFTLHCGAVGAISFTRSEAITEELAKSMSGDAYFIFKTAFEMAKSERKIKCEASGELLSGQELRILRLTADGMTAEQIAQRIFITKSTVNFHIKNITKKLSCKNKTQAIAKAALMSIL